MSQTVLIAILSFLTARPAHASHIPVETLLHVRLEEGIASATAEANQTVRARLIAPVIAGGSVQIPSGVDILGSVTGAHAASSATQAYLILFFHTLSASNGFHMSISAKVKEVDNAREGVDNEGRILGIVAADTLTSQADRGIQKLSNRYGGLAGLLEAAKTALVKPADPEIVYGAGVEMTLVLTRSLDLPQPIPDARPPLQPFSLGSGLRDLVAHQPLRAFALNPARPSDLTNLILIGALRDVQSAFASAGWSIAAALDSHSKLETVRAVMEERGYKEGPVSLLTIDGRPPDLVYQKTNDTFAARHHLRIWRRPGAYDGLPIWLVTATHDIGIAFSEEDGTFIHRIDSHIDNERSKVIDDLLDARMVRSLKLIDRAPLPANLTNATGDTLITDGRAAVLMIGSGPGLTP